MAKATATQPANRGAEATAKPAEDLLRGPVTGRHQVVTEKAAAFLGVPQEKIFDVVRGVWTTSKGQPPLSNQEIFTGLALIARYELDPFSREIYVTKDKKGRLLTILGIDGWVRVLDRTDHYDGFEQTMEMVDDSDVIRWVETKIYSKERSHPVVYRAFASEYGKLGGYVAGVIPGHMLRLFSLRHAARLFVPLGSVVTEEEAGWISDSPEAENAVPPDSLDAIADRIADERAPESYKPSPDTPEAREYERRASQEPQEADTGDPKEGPGDQTPSPTTPEQRAQLVEDYVNEFNRATVAGRISALEGMLDAAVEAGEILATDLGPIEDAMNQAKSRLSEVG